MYNGEADFGTVFYSPWAAPEGAEAWEIGDDRSKFLSIPAPVL